MKSRFLSTRARVVAVAGLVAIVGTVAVVGASAARRGHAAEHWGVLVRNTIGSPVAELRTGPYAPFGVSGPTSRPPFGKGSLGIYVTNNSTTLVPPSEKVDFGNEVDFFGDQVLALEEVGFHVFQTGENVGYGGPTNMPNIRFEIDANLTALPVDNFTTMVWVPDPILPASYNRWSGYIDATTTGRWYFTGAEGLATGCSDSLGCNFTQAMTALNDGNPKPIFYTVMVGKGRDNIWVGAVDGLRLNNEVYDFEETGVQVRKAGNGGGDDDD